MDIELLYFADCPNRHLAEERLSRALRAVGRSDLRIRPRAVESEHEARALGFPGSPTTRIGGADLFPVPARAEGVTCRVYATPDGLAGAPTVEQLVQVLGGTSGSSAPSPGTPPPGPGDG